MNNKILKALWGGLYALCACLSFVSQPEGIGYLLLQLCAVAFFMPPAILLYRAGKEKDRDTVGLVLKLSLLSLGATLLVLVANLLTIWSSSLLLGDILYYLLLFVSVPMICSQTWLVSLFLWACLLMCSLSLSRKLRK